MWYHKFESLRVEGETPKGWTEILTSWQVDCALQNAVIKLLGLHSGEATVNFVPSNAVPASFSLTATDIYTILQWLNLQVCRSVPQVSWFSLLQCRADKHFGPIAFHWSCPEACSRGSIVSFRVVLPSLQVKPPSVPMTCRRTFQVLSWNVLPQRSGTLAGLTCKCTYERTQVSQWYIQAIYRLFFMGVTASVVWALSCVRKPQKWVFNSHATTTNTPAVGTLLSRLDGSGTRWTRIAINGNPVLLELHPPE